MIGIAVFTRHAFYEIDHLVKEQTREQVIGNELHITVIKVQDAMMQS